MNIELNVHQKLAHAAFRAFVDEHIAPYACDFDRQERTPIEVIRKVAEAGYLATNLPKKDGTPVDMITYGLLHHEMGRGCSSLRSLLTVHDMVSLTVSRWASPEQKERWGPRLSSGELLGAFALSEPDAGSDAKSIETEAIVDGDDYVLRGKKKWITYGQIADLFLVFARCEGAPTAFLVPRTTPGLTTKPITGMLGFRASMLAELHFDDCCIPKEQLVGRRGFGLNPIGSMALDLGRYGVAWGCVGIGQACLEASVEHASQRKQGGEYLNGHQLVQQMLSNMLTDLEAARLLCYRAGYKKNVRDSQATLATLMAKYFASTMVARVASDAVQIHGARGCSSEAPVQRYLRDAKIMEIIEGSTQVQQMLIAQYGCPNAEAVKEMVG